MSAIKEREAAATPAGTPAAKPGFWKFRSDKDAWDASCKLSQLRSLLMVMYGNGAEWFECMGMEHRDNLVWIASDLAEAIGELMEEEESDHD